MSTSKTNLAKTKATETFKNTLYAYKDRVEALLINQPNINVETFLAIALNAVKRDKKLLAVVEKDPASLFASLLLCAEHGLSPSPEIGEAYLIPYGNHCQFQLGYQGLIKIAYRNPQIKSISAEVVYEMDEFDWGLGLEPFLNHKPATGQRGSLSHVYAVVKFRDAEPMFKVMTEQELKDIQRISKAGNKGIWFNKEKDPQGWMLKKTCLKQLLKLVPKELQLGKGMHYDNIAEGGKYVTLNSDDEIVEIKKGNPNFGKPNVFAQALEEVDTSVEVIDEGNSGQANLF